MSTKHSNENTVHNKIIQLYISGSTRSQIAKELKVSQDIIQEAIILSGESPDNSLKKKVVEIKRSLVGLRKIRINHNTEVHIRPDQDEEEVRERWLRVIKRNKGF